jgi:hypothetical protein
MSRIEVVNKAAYIKSKKIENPSEGFKHWAAKYGIDYRLEEESVNSVTEFKQAKVIDRTPKIKGGKDTETFLFHINKEMKEAIRLHCFNRRQPVAEFIRNALEKECEEHKITF